MTNKLKYILASAGTGKTESITSEIETLILSKNVDISKIAFITFTNKATKEMYQRLQTKIYQKCCEGFDLKEQLEKLSMASISTIHAFCDKIIREYGLRIGISPNFEISSYTEQLDKIVENCVDSAFDVQINSKVQTYLVKEMLKDFYNETADKGILPHFCFQSGSDFWSRFRNYFYQLFDNICEQIESCKRDENKLTNNDLLRFASILTSDEKIAQDIAKNVEYLFVDECQDINIHQKKIIENLLPYVNVTIVGDSKQSIYSFRGSDKNAFEELVMKMHKIDAMQTVANTNYRSCDELVKKINRLFGSKFKYKGKTLDFGNITLRGTGLKSNFAPCFEMVFGCDICQILKILSQNLAEENMRGYTDVVILCRTNKEVNNLMHQLKSAGFEAEIYTAKSLYKSKAIIDLYKVLRFILVGGEIEQCEIFYTDYYLSMSHLFQELQIFEVFEGLRFEAKHQTINFLLNRLLEVSKIYDFYMCLGREQYIANVNRLKEIFRELTNKNMSAIEILDYLNIMIEGQQNEPEPQIYSDAKIKLSTIHSFKGLSSEIVVIYNADRNLLRDCKNLYCFDVENNKIHFNRDLLALHNSFVDEDKEFLKILKTKQLEDLEEELRLLYVACTRAKQKLIIHSARPREKIKYLSLINPNYVSYTKWILESNWI